MSKTKLDEALDAAQEAANNVQAAQPQPQALAVVETENQVTVARPMGLMSLMSTGNMAVDVYLKVDEYGLHLGTSKVSFDTLKVKLVGMKACGIIRYGNPAVYEKTYDLLSSTKGESWSNVCTRALKADPKATQYQAAEITMVLNEDAKDSKGAVVYAAGTKVGYTSPPTGQKYVKELLEQLVKADLVDGDNLVGEPFITLGFVEVSKNGNQWGNVTFSPA